MIILVSSYGNHSNRLIQNLHFEAYCLDRNIPYYNTTFGDISRHYPEVAGSRSFLLNFVLKLLAKVASMTGLLKVISPNSVLELEQTGNRKIVLVSGWEFRDYHSTAKYKELFSSRYRIDESELSRNPAFQQLALWRQQGKKIVAVHIRRGDYRIWAEGKHFYADDIYRKYMDALARQLSQNGDDVRFMIFSDEKVTMPPDENHFISTSPWYIDHVMMSKCDFIIGPPSTFSMWASYIGNAKFLHIRDTEADFTLEDFRISN